jgi:monoamine oxidase
MRINHLFGIIIVIIFSFFLTGCFKWAARAKSKLPEQTALEKKYDYNGRVLIIGAGASGLAAAKVFEQNNIDYLILEATDRYGGRLKKDTILADFPIDIGAEWLHSAPITLNKLKGKIGEEIDEELIPYRLENTASWDGKDYKVNSDWINSFAYNFMPESKFKKSTWYDFIDKNIANYVKHKIQFNSPVTDIDYSGSKIIITTKGGKKYEADKVLVTVSIGVLKSKLISFKPEMGSEKEEAIESIVFEPGFKVVLKFNEKFYPDAIECEVENGEKVYYDMAFKKESKANILGFLCKGDLTQKYYELDSENKIISVLIEELDLMFHGKASSSFSGEYILENWGKYDYTLGTWTTAALERKLNLKTLNLPLEKKVYFAGEIYDSYQQMGVPGAILSGYYSADKLLTE